MPHWYLINVKRHYEERKSIMAQQANAQIQRKTPSSNISTISLLLLVCASLNSRADTLEATTERCEANVSRISQIFSRIGVGPFSQAQDCWSLGDKDRKNQISDEKYQTKETDDSTFRSLSDQSVQVKSPDFGMTLKSQTIGTSRREDGMKETSSSVPGYTQLSK